MRTPTRNRARHLFCLLVVPLLLAPPVNSIAQTHATESRHKTNEFIVKFKSEGDHALHECAHCLLSHTNRYKQFRHALESESKSIDSLNRKWKVKGARSVFVERHGLSSLDANQLQNERNEQIRSKFPKRAARGTARHSTPDLTNTYVFEVPEGSDIETIVEQYKNDPHVEFVQPNYLLVPNDETPDVNAAPHTCPLTQTLGNLYGLQLANVPAAWNFSQGEGIVVGVIDTGLDVHHDDLAANIWVNPGDSTFDGIDNDGNGKVDDVHGWNFLGNNNDLTDSTGHGTHVAGTVAAADNGFGVIGVAPKAEIMGLRCIGSVAQAASCIYYAAQNGADVINNSYSHSSSVVVDPAIELAVAYAHSQNVLVVFGAGNTQDAIFDFSPQNMGESVAVIATDQNDEKAAFSNYGYLGDVSAPGVDILSTHPGNLCRALSGTSMAAPHVSGLAALLASHRPDLTIEQMKSAIRIASTDMGPSGTDPYTGHGRIDAYSALTMPAPCEALIRGDTPKLLPDSATEMRIYGTATCPSFSNYRLEFSNDLEQWDEFAFSNSPVASGELGVLGGLTWIDGGVIRLTVESAHGKRFETYHEFGCESGSCNVLPDCPAGKECTSAQQRSYRCSGALTRETCTRNPGASTGWCWQPAQDCPADFSCVDNGRCQCPTSLECDAASDDFQCGGERTVEQCLTDPNSASGACWYPVASCPDEKVCTLGACQEPEPATCPGGSTRVCNGLVAGECVGSSAFRECQVFDPASGLRCWTDVQSCPGAEVCGGSGQCAAPAINRPPVITWVQNFATGEDITHESSISVDSDSFSVVLGATDDNNHLQYPFYWFNTTTGQLGPFDACYGGCVETGIPLVEGANVIWFIVTDERPGLAGWGLKAMTVDYQPQVAGPQPQCWVSSDMSKRRVEERFRVDITCTPETDRFILEKTFDYPPTASNAFVPQGATRPRPSGSTGNWTRGWGGELRMVKAWVGQQLRIKAENSFGSQYFDVGIPSARKPRVEMRVETDGVWGGWKSGNVHGVEPGSRVQFRIINGIPEQGCNDTQVEIKFIRPGNVIDWAPWKGGQTTNALGQAMSDAYSARLYGSYDAYEVKLRMRSKDGECNTPVRHEIFSSSVFYYKD